MRTDTRGGFTLMELLGVMAVIGILVAVLVPNLTGARTRAYRAQALACAKAVATAQEIYHSENHAYAQDASALDPHLLKGCSGMGLSVLYGARDSFRMRVVHKGISAEVTQYGIAFLP